MNQKIIPSVLVYSADEITARLNAVGNFVSTVQLDVLDNTLIPYVSFHDPELIDRLVPKVSFEVHLMVKDVQAAILKWDYPWVKKIIFHSEADIDPREGCRHQPQNQERPKTHLRTCTSHRIIRKINSRYNTPPRKAQF
ncbi:MAG: hypothetical protein M1275_02125 [Patescibacteria group bacterium]|nr:hypothetical protein [Patescibacteria group bacterium]